MVKWMIFPLLLLLVTLISGCKKGTPSAKGKYNLATEPTGALGVIALRKTCKNGDEILVVGRVGGEKEAIISGRAAFSLADGSLKPCNERADDDCKTPWDYCCDPPEVLKEAVVLVKFVNDQGETLQVDARELLGIRELQTVVVKGRAKRDDAGNLTILASGLFVRP